MSFEKIFVLDSEGNIEINPLAKQIPEYKMVLMKDKGSEGDYDGRRKLKSKKEFLYIYHMCDPRSLCYNLGQIDKEIVAKKTAGLPEDWKESDFIIDAIVRYKLDIILTATGNSYYAAEKGLFSVAEDIKYLQDENENLKSELREELKKMRAMRDTADRVTAIAEITNLIKTITDNQKNMSTVIQSLPKLKQTVDELAAKYAEEGGGSARIHGGGTLGNREA